MRLQNKVAIVTGAASGIGKQIALTFAREGGLVAIADLNRDAANATAREIDHPAHISSRPAIPVGDPSKDGRGNP